jgi:hypothetical protein
MRLPRLLQKPSLLALTSAGVLAALLARTSPAEACGCFAPPDPSVPIVQAGERILFAHEDGHVIAHIQIQYAGSNASADFGWLLPLPSVPQLELGTDELFASLIDTTQPKYRLIQNAGDACEWNNFRGAFPTADAGSGPPQENGTVVVVQDSIGPYDYAVLSASTRDEMLEWLTTNGYFIPTGTEDVVGPYINQGAYFLALKLRSGNDAGDIAPVVLRYPSDLPMIPIILTSVAANPDMGVQVWVAGEARAIPRNYRHTVINEEHIDWFSAGANYNDVIIAATNEAPDGQSFVTEYAGTAEVMNDRLAWPGRFGEEAALAANTEAGAFVAHLRGHGFAWTSPLVAILRRTFPFPAGLAARGVAEEEYYAQLDYFLNYDRTERPDDYAGVDFSFDPVATAAELFDRIVEPNRAAEALLERHPKLTRMYTTLSPEEMTRDPVFSFNPDLEDVSNIHEASFEYLCTAGDDQQATTPGVLTLPDGRRFYVSGQAEWQGRARAGVPFSTRIELLREEGVPEVELDNSGRISPTEKLETTANGCGCDASQPADGASGVLAMLFGLGLIRSRRARR